MPVIASPTSPATGMTVEAARAWVRNAVRDGTDDTAEGAANVDRAIMLAGNHFCRATRYVKRTDSVAITSGSTVFPLAASIAAGFLPERILDAWVGGQPDPLRIAGYAELNTLAADGAYEGTGAPTRLAFLDNASDGLLWPTPAASYTARLRFWQPFTTWTIGGTDGGTLATQLNIPTDVIMPVLNDGAAAILKGPSPEKAFGSQAWGRFLAYERQMTGAGGLGERTVQRNSAYGRPLPRRVILE
jgi:hypothetical protein